ncbi:transposase [Streptomyces milbemycinicus]|uniref:transposase n=1 Tax=Streptomyces milbemycinicus TaxID=476552 RepID=UPI0033F4EF31
MGSQYSKRYSEEFKRDAIAFARSSDKTITEVARDLGVSPERLRGWVKRDRIDRGGGMSGGAQQGYVRSAAAVPALAGAPVIASRPGQVVVLDSSPLPWSGAGTCRRWAR